LGLSNLLIFPEALGPEYWTSGSNVGENCDLQQKYSWCSSDDPVNSSLLTNGTFWLDGKWPPSFSTSERCLTVNLDSAKSGVRHRNCDSALPLICEVISHYF